MRVQLNLKSWDARGQHLYCTRSRVCCLLWTNQPNFQNTTLPSTTRHMVQQVAENSPCMKGGLTVGECVYSFRFKRYPTSYGLLPSFFLFLPSPPFPPFPFFFLLFFWEGDPFQCHANTTHACVLPKSVLSFRSPYCFVIAVLHPTRPPSGFSSSSPPPACSHLHVLVLAL